MLSFCGMKCFINKEQKSSAVRHELMSLLCGPCNTANMVTCLFVVFIMKNWDRLSDLLRAQNSPIYPKTSLPVLLLFELHSCAFF